MINTVTLPGHVGLPSLQLGDLAVQRTATELDKRNLHIAAPAPTIWNTLPNHAHPPSPKDSFGVA